MCYNCVKLFNFSMPDIYENVSLNPNISQQTESMTTMSFPLPLRERERESCRNRQDPIISYSSWLTLGASMMNPELGLYDPHMYRPYNLSYGLLGEGGEGVGEREVDFVSCLSKAASIEIDRLSSFQCSQLIKAVSHFHYENHRSDFCFNHL